MTTTLASLDTLPQLRMYYAKFHGGISLDGRKTNASVKTLNDNSCAYVISTLLFDAARLGQTSFTTLKNVRAKDPLIFGTINDEVVVLVQRAGILVESCVDFNETVQYRFSFDPTDTTVVVYETPTPGISNIAPVVPIADIRQIYRENIDGEVNRDLRCADIIIKHLSNDAANHGRCFYNTFKQVKPLSLWVGETFTINDAVIKLVTDTGIRVETKANFDGVVHYHFSFNPEV